MSQSTLASVAASATAPTMDELAPWIPLALGAVAILAIILIVVAATKRRRSERETLDTALDDAKQAVRETTQDKGRHTR